MPILQNMKTVWVTDKPWNSPDGKVTIWMIKLEDPTGERGDWSTMSKALATEGFSGDIEVYTNDKGKTYVRQAPKDEGPQYGGETNNAPQGQSNTPVPMQQPQAKSSYDNVGAKWGNAINAAIATVEMYSNLNSTADTKPTIEDIQDLVIKCAKFYFAETPVDLNLPKGW